MQQKVVSFVILVMLIPLLTGCITYQTATTVKPDGSGSNVMIMAFTWEALALMEDEDPFAEFSEGRNEMVGDWEVQVEPWENETYKGIQIFFDFSNLDMLEDQLNTILGPESEDGMFGPFTVNQDGQLVSITTSFYVEGMGDQELDPETAALLEGYKVMWSIELPSIISYGDQRIATLDGNRVTWDIPVMQAETETFYMEAVGSLDEGVSDGEDISLPAGGGASEPTVVVTDEPTVVVTDEPTVVVTEEPTVVVTEEPTVVVTEEPTVVVTEEPTVVVTEEPTVVVTEEPTTEPTVVVTDEPTVVVTEEPTVVVTEEPTVVVTEEPTVVVTDEPTVVPTDEPTVVVTEEPTVVVTDEPTLVATEEPTVVPTDEPTVVPTDASTTEPTVVPTVKPATEPTAIPTDARCFDEVTYCISGRVREYWEENGGLSVFGYPISAQYEEIIEDQPYQVQWFERNRMELHPEKPRPYDVLLGRLGYELVVLQGRDWWDFPMGQPTDGCLYFEETRHSICGDYLTTWRSHGLEVDGEPGFSSKDNLALFGYPLSEPMEEELEDGEVYMVQYFERVRIEYHPENPEPHDMLFGLLGSEVQ